MHANIHRVKCVSWKSTILHRVYLLDSRFEAGYILDIYIRCSSTRLVLGPAPESSLRIILAAARRQSDKKGSIAQVWNSLLDATAVRGRRFSVQLPPNYRRQLITRINFGRFSGGCACALRISDPPAKHPPRASKFKLNWVGMARR